MSLERIKNGSKFDDFRLGFQGPLCGGAIISKWQFLMAAHCVHIYDKKKEDWFILVGSANASELYHSSGRLNGNSLNVHKVTLSQFWKYVFESDKYIKYAF